MTEGELKSCEVKGCGEEPYTEYDLWSGQWHVECACGNEGPNEWTEAEAITAWNNRARKD